MLMFMLQPTAMSRPDLNPGHPGAHMFLLFLALRAAAWAIEERPEIRFARAAAEVVGVVMLVRREKKLKKWSFISI